MAQTANKYAAQQQQPAQWVNTTGTSVTYAPSVAGTATFTGNALVSAST